MLVQQFIRSQPLLQFLNLRANRCSVSRRDSESVALALQVLQCIFLKQLCVSLRLDIEVKEMIVD